MSEHFESLRKYVVFTVVEKYFGSKSTPGFVTESIRVIHLLHRLYLLLIVLFFLVKIMTLVSLVLDLIWLAAHQPRMELL